MEKVKQITRYIRDNVVVWLVIRGVVALHKLLGYLTRKTNTQ